MSGWRIRFGLRGRKIMRIEWNGLRAVAYDKRGFGHVGQWVRRTPQSGGER